MRAVLVSYTTLGFFLARGFYNFSLAPAHRPIVVGSLSGYDICIMHQTSWVHRHLQACNFVFDPGWRRQSRQWCVHQLFAGRFQDHGAYRKWRVDLHHRRDGARDHRAIGASSSTCRGRPCPCSRNSTRATRSQPSHEIVVPMCLAGGETHERTPRFGRVVE